MTDHRERELTLDVPDEWELPDPAELADAVERDVVRLENTYFDTAEQDLLNARVTLRRRTGDTDTGWHLKLPDRGARLEIHVPLGGRGVPAELRELTQGIRGGAALKSVATVRTVRNRNRLIRSDGVVLAELVVDEVTSTRYREFAITKRWREIEVELVDGDEDVLTRVSQWLLEHGAEPAAVTSKLARTLGRAPRAPYEPGTLSGLIRSYLDEQYERMLRGEVGLRRDEDTIRPTRLATRRYRSALRAYIDVLDADRARALDAELAWFAAALGAVRDCQVMRAHLLGVLDGLPAALVVGPVRERIVHTLDTDEQAARTALTQVLRSRRYFALQQELRRWLEQQPIVEERPADAARAFLRRAHKTVRTRLARAKGADDRDEQLHRARKAAKRARYAAELAEPGLGKLARKAGKRAKKVQRRLGERQDGVVAEEFLRRVAADARAARGEDGFTYGLLYAQEMARVRNAD